MGFRGERKHKRDEASSMLTVLLQVGFGTLDMVALERDLVDQRLEMRDRQGVQVAPCSLDPVYLLYVYIYIYIYIYLYIYKHIYIYICIYIYI